MTTVPEWDVPHHFGHDQELFGMYSPAASSGSCAVLMCPPLGQEMIRTHRIYRQLAHSLAARGLGVLRFDYYGTGDSAGESRETEWTRCIENTRTASEHLRELSGCKRIVAFGTRLGATVILSSPAHTLFDGILLWDPILDGTRHVKVMDALQNTLPADSMRFPQPRSPDSGTGQWLGFEIHPMLREQLSVLHVTPPETDTRIFDSRPETDTEDWSMLTDAGANIVRLQGSVEWDSLDRLEHAILLPDLVKIVETCLMDAE